MIEFTNLFVSFKDYPFTFWLGVITFCLMAGNFIGQLFFGHGLRDIPSVLKPAILLAVAALLTPMAVEASLALIEGRPLPNTVGDGDWSMAGWPMLGITAWISFVSMSITCLVYQLSEPVKEEIFARLPRPWMLVHYFATAIMAALIYFASLGGLAYVYSYHREIPLLSREHLLLLSAGYGGLGLAFALVLRTFGVARWIGDVTALIMAGALTGAGASSLDLPDIGWVYAIVAFSTLTWSFWGSARAIGQMIRQRKRAEGEPLSLNEQKQESRLVHVCSQCDREFVTKRGLNIHRTRMHSAPM